MPSTSSFRAPPWLLALAIFAVGVAITLGAKALGLNRGPMAAGILAAVVFAAATPGILLYWRRLDEAAQEAHKFAWYWGGSAGMVAVAIAFSVLMAPGANIVTADFLGAEGPSDLLAYGMIGAFMSQMVGYMVAWVGWWIARR